MLQNLERGKRGKEKELLASDSFSRYSSILIRPKPRAPNTPPPGVSSPMLSNENHRNCKINEKEKMEDDSGKTRSRVL